MHPRRSPLSFLAPFLLLAAPFFATPDAQAQTPALETESPIDLLFPEPTSASKIYRSLGQVLGYDIVFDPKFRDSELSLELHGIEPWQALDAVTTSAGHFYMKLPGRALLIADDTPQNRRTHERVVIQLLPVENARPGDVMTTLRSLLGVKYLALHEDTSTLVLRESAEKAKIAEYLVALVDKPRPEVEVEIEVFEIGSRQLDRVLGRVGRSRLDPGDFDRFRAESGVRTLARPTLSALEGETAHLLLGDRLPLGAGAEGAPTYQEIGLELWFKPWVHPRSREISFEFQLKVSSLASTPGNDAWPTVGAREITSSQRLSEGQTLLFAGMMYNGEGEGSSLPTIGRLFGADARDAKSREVVLALTPRIVREPGYDELELAPRDVGTESSIAWGEGEN